MHLREFVRVYVECNNKLARILHCQTLLQFLCAKMIGFKEKVPRGGKLVHAYVDAYKMK